MPAKKPERVILTVPIDSITPYWRNPRNIENAIDKVADSITRYGFQQPILVDKKHVIIAGHTRYAALRKLGIETAEIIVADLTAKKAKEYRVIDNRTSEYATWSDDLDIELREFLDDTLEVYFPDLALDSQLDAHTPIVVQQDEIDRVEAELANAYNLRKDEMSDERALLIACPECLNKIILNRAEVEGLLKGAEK